MKYTVGIRLHRRRGLSTRHVVEVDARNAADAREQVESGLAEWPGRAAVTQVRQKPTQEIDSE